MNRDEEISEGVGKKVNARDRTTSRKRQWVRPAIRKLKVNQTEASLGPGDDGVIEAFS